MAVKLYETKLIPTDKVVPSPWNPNEEEEAKFNLLVESIQRDGFLQPIAVVPLEDGTFRLVGGEHRHRAARLLEMPEIPATILTDFDELAQKVNLVHMNLISGKLSPSKFARLYNDLAKTVPPEALKRLLGFASDAEFERAYRLARENLPAELRKKLDAAKKEIQTVEDLARVLNRIMSQAGTQLDCNFVNFQLAGRDHVMVRCEPDVFKLVKLIAEKCETEQRDINGPLYEALRAWWDKVEGGEKVAGAVQEATA